MEVSILVSGKRENIMALEHTLQVTVITIQVHLQITFFTDKALTLLQMVTNLLVNLLTINIMDNLQFHIQMVISMLVNTKMI